MIKGLFVTFEGLEGCGKSTQVKMLFHLLSKKGIPVMATKEPGGTKIGDEIRKILLDQKNNGMDYKAEMLLFLASRSENVRLKYYSRFRKRGNSPFRSFFLTQPLRIKVMGEE